MRMCQTLSDALLPLLRRQWGITDICIVWEVSIAEHGDVATPLAMQLAQRVHQPPREIAERLCACLRRQSAVERCAVAGPGYVNVWLTPAVLLEGLRAVHTACIPSPVRRVEGPVIVEYSQPNIAKPLGVHHILSTVIGQSLANLHRHLGYPTIAINHIGDWGTQFGKLSVAMQRWGTGVSAEELGLDGLLSLYVRFHQEAEGNPHLEEEARAAFKRLEQGDGAMRAFWEDVVAVTLRSLDAIYKRLGVSFDLVQGESFYGDTMQPIIDEGKTKGIFEEGEGGALIVQFPGEKHIPPFMVLKGDGATLYATRDLATIRYRVDRWHPQSILYVVDVAQQLYFQQLFATVERLGWNVPHCEHVLFGRMSFADVTMSTRKGTVLKLEHVLDEAVERAREVIRQHRAAIQTDDERALAEMMGVGALVYGILSQNRKMDIVFDWEKFLSFEGNSAPYLMYTFARARSVLRKAGPSELAQPDGHAGGRIGSSTFSLVEHALLLHLLRFPDILDEARTCHMPHMLCRYLYELCQRYNAFYNAEPILQAPPPLRRFRLELTQCTADVLRTGAAILTLQLPDQM